ncbi:MAG: arylsulfatase [Pseudomonadota bacterium]
MFRDYLARLIAMLPILLALLPAIAIAASAPPNVVIILVDDAGFMDFGGYGGEARTPTIDAIADEGVRFSNYHTSPLCAPSRAMLLTGLSNHRAGVATIPEVITAEQSGQPGYSLRFEEGVETVATKLKRAGYRTYMTGKWHLGHGPGDLPVDHGFDRSFILDASGADNFEQKPYMPYYETADWFEDGEPATLPEDFYSSDFIVDKMIEYLDGADGPFFSYLAFQAIHIPLQAPTEFIERYAGEFEEGWDVLREARWQKAKEIGLIPADSTLAPMHASMDGWDSLTASERAYYAKSMQVNAAMLEAMDAAIARLVAYLESRDAYNNTLFFITSDNGPEFNEPATSGLFQYWMSQNGYTSETATLGEPGTIAHIGPEWATAASTPGQLFKFYATEGGLRVPLIVAGAGVRQRPGFEAAPAFVTDIVPTVLEVAGEDSSGVDGVSLLSLLTGGPGPNPDRGVAIEVSGNIAYFKSGLKLSKLTLPFGDEQWRLHDIVQDPGETRDLASEMPELFELMLSEYNAYAEQVGVIAPPAGFNPVQQVGSNSVRRMLWSYRTTMFVAMAAILALILGAFAWWRRRR